MLAAEQFKCRGISVKKNNHILKLWYTTYKCKSLVFIKQENA